MSTSDWAKIINTLKGSYSLGNNTLPVVKEHAVRNKWDGSTLAYLSFTSISGCKIASQRAQAAFKVSIHSSSEQRYRLLMALKEGLEAQKALFVQCIEWEAGKTFAYANAEFNRSLLTLESGAAFCFQPRNEGVAIDFGAGVDKTAMVERVGIGPVLAFSPFNFPLNLLLHKLVPAWVAGNPIVVKPSPETPLTALLLASVFEQVAKEILHPAMLQVVVCDNETAAEMVTDDAYPIFSFTGSDKVGWELKAKCNRKKVLLELGGVAPLIIAPDADLAKVCRSLVAGAFLYGGQTCISTQHVWVPLSLKDTFKSLFSSEVTRQSNDLACPLIHSQSRERIEKWLENVQAKGAIVETLSAHVLPYNALPFYLVENLSYLDEWAQEEIFGPVVCLHYYTDEQEMITELNQSRFGLQAGLFTQDQARVKRFFKQLQMGGLIINEVPGFRIDTMPYGGIKASGIGREGIAYAFEEMTERKLLVW